MPSLFFHLASICLMGILRVWRWWSQARRSGVMGFAGDNLKGSLLAVLSSGFIGASYVIMKKGLRRAADASGVRAGDFPHLISSTQSQ